MTARMRLLRPESAETFTPTSEHLTRRLRAVAGEPASHQTVHMDLKICYIGEGKDPQKHALRNLWTAPQGFAEIWLHLEAVR